MNRKGLFFNKSTLRLRKDGILHIDICPDETFTREDVIEILIGSKQLGGGKKIASLINVGPYTVADKEARELAVQPGFCKYRIADAFVVSTLSQKIVANFYLKVNKPPIPTRFFKTEKEALKWLNKIIASETKEKEHQLEAARY